MTSLPRDIPALTGLRSFAAWWVVVQHFGPWLLTLPGAALLAPIVHSGHIGVDVFFVLSGFILAHNYLHRFQNGVSAGQWGRFLQQRLARIYPTHLVTLLIMLALFLLFGPLDPAVPYTPASFLANVFLVHAWGGPGLWTWNYPAWRISCEWAAYLTFPVLAWLGMRVRSGWLAAGLAAVSLLFMLAGMFVTARADLEGAQPLIRIAGEFTAGVLMYRAQQLGAMNWLRGAWSPLAAAGGLIGVAAAAIMVGVDALVAVPFAALLVPALALGHGRIVEALSRPAAVYWGQVSFAVYMVHGIIELLTRRFMPVAEFAAMPLVARLIIVVGLMAMVALTAQGMFRFVEEPARKRLRPAVPATLSSHATIPAASAPNATQGD